jgi:Xaa-Pro aminopeptidase
VNDRLRRLQAQITDPLLVTNPVNVVYLVGFHSSNCALLVERDRVRLYTDFRYLQAARAVEQAETVQTKRNVLGELADTLTGRVGIEANAVSYANYEVLKKGTFEPVATYGVIEQLRAVKDADELEALRRACAITDRVFERLTDVRFVGRMGSRRALPCGRRQRARLRVDRRLRPNRLPSACTCGRAEDRQG